MCDFQVRLDESERPSCMKRVEISSSLQFMRTSGKVVEMVDLLATELK